MSTSNFTDLLSPALLANLDSLGYQQMTPIQQASLPAILKGQDLIAQAKTGSGKTVAFGIGLLSRLDPQDYQVQALILCPTRELADQVSKEIRRLARFIPNIKLLSLCGGTPIRPQYESLQRNAHIVVGTPGRIQQHLDKGALNLEQVNTLVLDEADRMLDMGFYDDIIKIIKATPKNRQTLLFSATYPDAIKKMSAGIQKNPLEVKVEITHRDNPIEQLFFEISKPQRAQNLIALLAHYRPESAVIFCNTKIQCQEVADELEKQGLHALVLNGDLEQKDRDRVLLLFTNKSCPLLIATDVAARGLDIKDLQAVINYEIPYDPEIYIHRIGRTGRAGKQGLALSLYIPAESERINAIEDYQKHPVTFVDINSLQAAKNIELLAPMITLCIDGGRKNKIRPGDILGALTGDAGIDGKFVGKIDISDNYSYVAIERSMANQAVKQLAEGTIKGRKLRVWKVR
ncbi:MAG: ATP-dependent RNA helicase DbpA [Methylococcaceae bacterium]